MGTVQVAVAGTQLACSYTVAPALPLVPAVWSDAIADSLGVCTHLTYTSYRNRKAAISTAMADLGLRHARTRLYLNADGDAQRAWMVELHNATGVVFNVVMGEPLGNQSVAELVAYLPTFPVGVIGSVEGANEWNLEKLPGTNQTRPSWVAELRAHQQELYQTMKAATNPDWVRTLPVLAPALGMRKDYAALGDISQWCDLGNTHCYPNAGDNPGARFDDCIAGVRLNSGAKPIRFTEVGYNTAPASTGTPYASSETSQALNTAKVILELFRRGVRRGYVYEMLDEGTNTANAEHNFGLLRFDGSRKPVFSVLQQILSPLSDPGPTFTPPGLRCTVTGMPADGTWVLAQNRAGRSFLLAWRDVPVYDVGARAAVPVPPVNVTWTTQAGPLTFPLGAAVVILEAT